MYFQFIGWFECAMFYTLVFLFYKHIKQLLKIFKSYEFEVLGNVSAVIN